MGSICPAVGIPKIALLADKNIPFKFEQNLLKILKPVLLCSSVATLLSIPLVGWIKLRCVPMGPTCSWDNGISVPEKKWCCRRTSELLKMKRAAQVSQLGSISCIFFFKKNIFVSFLPKIGTSWQLYENTHSYSHIVHNHFLTKMVAHGLLWFHKKFLLFV